MKLLILLVVVVLACIVLFVAGALSPAKSRRLQKSVDNKSRKAEKKGYEKAGSLGDMSSDALKKGRHAADHSAEKGRQIHDEIAPD